MRKTLGPAALLIAAAALIGCDSSSAPKPAAGSSEAMSVPRDLVAALSSHGIECTDVRSVRRNWFKPIPRKQVAYCDVRHEGLTMIVFTSAPQQEAWVDRTLYQGCNDTGVVGERGNQRVLAFSCLSQYWLVGDSWAVLSNRADGAVPKIRRALGGYIASGI
jgi:hypothetical protein